VANFLPSCRKMRQELKEATEIITPVLEESRDLEAARNANQPPNRYDDAMQWMEKCAKSRPYLSAEAQMAFSLVAIRTTSNMLTQVLLDLCGHEDVIQRFTRTLWRPSRKQEEDRII
jgi:hypothetical protein